MKNLSAALINFLNANKQYLITEFYTITPKVGPVLTYSSADLSLTYNIPAQTVAGGTVYNPLSGMRIARGRMRVMLGTQTDQMDVILYPQSTDLINGQLVPFEILNGALDGSWCSIDRAFLSSWSSAGIVGTANIFAGRVSTSVIGRTSVKLTIKSPIELLNMNFPRNVYQPGCMHNVYDAGCTLSAAAFTVATTVINPGGLGPPNNNSVICNLNTFPGDQFTLGYATFTSGALINQTRSVLVNSGPVALGGQQVTYVGFTTPWPIVPSVGDVFTLTAGCDHQLGTCRGKFANVANFRGQPFIPQPETAQ